MTAPSWWRARSLSERAGQVTADAEGTRRAQAWARRLPDDGVLQERLAASGVAPGELAAALSHSLPPADVDVPPWWTEVESVLAPGGVSSVKPRERDEDLDLLWGALRLSAPFAKRALDRLREHPGGRRDAALRLAENLAEELAALCRPALSLEVTATRVVEGWRPEEAEDRTLELLRGLGQAERARVLLEEHPGLARQITDRARLATEAGMELLDRLDADADLLASELLGGAATDDVARIHGAGDAHDGGRRVSIVFFASGAAAVLKPRSLVVDAAYQDLLRALNDAGFTPPLRPLVTLTAGPHHGWQELAEPAACTQPAQVERYFRRLGAQLAVLHALRANDMHFENLLACGEHPVIVDLETLLHPRIGGARAGEIDPLLSPTGEDSLLRVGLLPRDDGGYGVDISGIGSDPDAALEMEGLEWEGVGSEARLVRRSVPRPRGDNAVRLGKTGIHPGDHVPALERGFADAYRLLVEHRDELLDQDGPLDAMRGAALRVVLRPTRLYGELLRVQSTDISCLDDGLAREEELNALWRASLRRPDVRQVAEAERHDLWLGDVPKFTARSGGADAAHHALGPIPGLLGPHAVPGPEVIRRLDERDLARQLHLLRAAVVGADARPRTGARTVPVLTVPTASDRGEEPDVLLRAALRAAERLAVLALWDGDQASWLVPAASPNQAGRLLAVAGPGAATGQAGICLALARLGRVVDDDQVLELGRGALRRLFVLAEVVLDRELDASIDQHGLAVALLLASEDLGLRQDDAARRAADLLAATRPEAGSGDRARRTFELAVAVGRGLGGDPLRDRLEAEAASLTDDDEGRRSEAAEALAHAATALGNGDLCADAAELLGRADHEDERRAPAARVAVTTAARALGLPPVASEPARTAAVDPDGPTAQALGRLALQAQLAALRSDEAARAEGRRTATRILGNEPGAGTFRYAVGLERCDLVGLSGTVLAALALQDPLGHLDLAPVLASTDPAG